LGSAALLSGYPAEAALYRSVFDLVIPADRLAGSLLLSCDVRELEHRMTVSTAKLTEKFQITIPAAVRRRLGIKAGDVVYLLFESGQVVLRAALGGWTESSRGLGRELWRKEGGAAAVDRERDSWK
jgi:AbrB family looped-hinge helix DNA binding protein